MEFRRETYIGGAQLVLRLFKAQHPRRPTISTQGGSISQAKAISTDNRKKIRGRGAGVGGANEHEPITVTHINGLKTRKLLK